MTDELRILMVEDEVITAMVMEADLQDAGYPVSRRVSSGEEAVSLAAEEVFDVVLMDIRLAGQIDGVEAARRIQEIRETPVIFMTGYQDEETHRRAEELSPLAYLVKPVNGAQLASLLGQVSS